MVKHKVRFILQIISLLAVFLFFIVSLFRGKSLAAIISFFMFFSLFIMVKEYHRYDCNVPYRKKKIKKNILSRIFTGLLAGVHYVHFMFSYNHKKYNTQVDIPKSLECYVGNIWIIFLFFYGFISYKIYLFFGGYWYLIVPGILIATNLIDFIRFQK